MPRIYDSMPATQHLAIAVCFKAPTQLALAFAAQVGQFYDRTEFDALARRTSDLYAIQNPEDANLFRTRLDRRLYDRYHTPVTWHVSAQVNTPSTDASPDVAASGRAA